MATFTDKATGNWEATGQTTWNEVSYPQSADTVTINSFTVTETQAEACSGIVIGASGTLDIATFNQVNSGSTDVTGTLIIDDSAGTGLTTAGLSLNSVGSADFQNDSLINNSGNLSINNIAVFVGAYGGTYVQTASGNIQGKSYLNKWVSFTQNVGADLTLSATAFIYGTTTILNADIITAGYGFNLQGTTTLTFNATANISGSGSIFFRIAGSETVNWNRTSAISATGEVTFLAFTSTLAPLSLDFTNNSKVILNNRSAGTCVMTPASGTLKCQDFETLSDGQPITVNNNTNDPSYEISGDIDLNVDAVTLTWNAGTGSITGTGSSGTQTWALDGQSIEDIILNCSGATKQLTENAGTTDSLTITAGTLDMQTFNLTSAGVTDVIDGLIIGTSAGTGLTTAGLNFATGAVFTAQTNSLINNSGDLIFSNSQIHSIAGRGTYVQTGNGNASGQSYLNRWFSFTSNNGTTLTQTGNLYPYADTVVLNGDIDTAGFQLNIGGTNVTFNSTADILGNGKILFRMATATTFAWNRTTAITATGIVTFGSLGPATLVVSEDFSNNSLVALDNNRSAGVMTLTPTAGTLKCKDFEIQSSSGNDLTIDNTNSPSFEVSGDVDLNVNGVTVTWTKDTGSFTGTGSSGTQTWDLDGQTLEDIILNCSGATKELVGDFSSDSLSGSGGILQSDTPATQRVITVTNTGVASNCTFKDISMGSANKVNAKNGSTNNGNTLGIVFTDILQPSLMSF